MSSGKDIVFLQDLSGSFSNDLSNVRNSIPEIIQKLQSKFPDSTYALSTLIDGGDYVAVTPSTTNSADIVSAYDQFSASGNEREAVLGALVNASSGTDLNLRDSASYQRIVIVATDEPYRVSSPPDNTSIQDVIDALNVNNAVPIFAVTSGERDTYEDLVNQLGSGFVVTITSNSDNFADAIRAAAAYVSGELTQLGDDNDNTLLGSDTSNDGIFGGLGNDTVLGKGGDDIVDGGAGNDKVYGGAGNDTVEGGSGDDDLFGDAPTATLNLSTSAQSLSEAFSLSRAAASDIVNLNNLFSLQSDPDIADSTTVPHATMDQFSLGGVERFVVTLPPGATITVDIDGANEGSVSFDSILRLYGPDGSLISQNDDSSTSNGAGGSSSSRDSFLTETVTSLGNYLIEVDSYSSGDGVPFGADYSIHVSVDGVIDVGGTGEAGNDVIDGGAGTDTAYFSGSRSDYVISGSTVSGNGQTDTVTNVERFVFDDFQLDVSAARGDNEGALNIARFYNPTTGLHFYTANPEERDSLIMGGIWNFESNEFDSSASASSGTEIFRLFNTLSGSHFYTMNSGERDAILSDLGHFNDEGVGYYAYDSDGAGRTELYRFFNTLTGTHFFTTNEDEKNNIIQSLGHFNYEGVAFYVDLA